MTSLDLKNNRITLRIVLFFLGALAGAAGAHDYDTASENADAEKSASSVTHVTLKSVDLRIHLISLAAEYMANVDKTVDQLHDAGGGVDVSTKALYDNGITIGQVIGSIYGKEVETEFTTVWKVHLDDFIKYTSAADGDIGSKAAALADIDAHFTKPLAVYLAKINPTISEGTFESALRSHVVMAIKAIDYRKAGDYTNEQMELGMAYQHIEGLFGTLASAIVQQYPNKFN